MSTKGNSNTLRELIRVLVRNLGILEKDGATCCGITISQCHAIIEIGRRNKISLNQLAEILNLDKSTMSRTVNKLVNQGLVERSEYKEDRRYIKIQLTEAGQKIFESIEDNMSTYYSNILEYLPKEKIEQIMESLSLLNEAIENNKAY